MTEETTIEEIDDASREAGFKACKNMFPVILVLGLMGAAFIFLMAHDMSNVISFKSILFELLVFGTGFVAYFVGKLAAPKEGWYRCWKLGALAEEETAFYLLATAWLGPVLIAILVGLLVF